jgi:hypothetical protein
VKYLFFAARLEHTQIIITMPVFPVFPSLPNNKVEHNVFLCISAGEGGNKSKTSKDEINLLFVPKLHNRSN